MLYDPWQKFQSNTERESTNATLKGKHQHKNVHGKSEASSSEDKQQEALENWSISTRAPVYTLKNSQKSHTHLY